MDKTKFKFQFRGVGFSDEAKASGTTKKPDQLIITEMTGPGNSFFRRIISRIEAKNIINLLFA